MFLSIIVVCVFIVSLIAENYLHVTPEHAISPTYAYTESFTMSGVYGWLLSTIKWTKEISSCVKQKWDCVCDQLSKKQQNTALTSPIITDNDTEINGMKLLTYTDHVSQISIDQHSGNRRMHDPTHHESNRPQTISPPATRKSQRTRRAIRRYSERLQ
jgi:hypothetical protein